MESDRWPQIYAGIQQHLQKIYNGKKAALKERYWVPEEDGTYDLERLRRGRPSHISEVNWDAQLAFWNDPKNLARAAQNKQNRAKSKVVCRQGSRAQLLESTLLIPYLPLDNILVYGVFLNPEDKALYVRGDAEVNRVSAPTPRWVSPTTEDEIMAIVRGGKQRGHIPGVGRVLPGQRTVIPTLRLHARTPLMSVFHDEERELTPVDGRFLLKHYANFIQSFETYQAASAAPTSAAHQSPKSTGVEFQQFIHFWTRGRYVVLLICEGFIPFLSGSQMPSYNAANFDLSNVTCNVLETSQSNMAAVLAVNSIDITTEIS
ncbi:hypothetical protein Tco_0098387 [Tanacetum coccineum]